MSDLSGPNIVPGFEDYLTGYPLLALDAYAFARTWYAPEMKRPGCVWTHTLLVPREALSTLYSMDVLLEFFRRPETNLSIENYRESIPVDRISSISAVRISQESRPKLTRLIHDFYGRPNEPLLIAANTSHEFDEGILALWSQQWPALRETFTFSTGSLSARFIGAEPLALQCVPTSLMREVFRDSRLAINHTREPNIELAPKWAVISSIAALASFDDVREFLWEVADNHSGRENFAEFVGVFSLLSTTTDSQSAQTVVDYIGVHFPKRAQAVRLKKVILGQAQSGIPSRTSETGVLFALSTTEHHRAFDSDLLNLEDRGRELWSAEPGTARRMIHDLFRAALNPLGERILRGLISEVNVNEARALTAEQPALLSPLFGANPKLAASPSLWPSAVTRIRELFDSVSADESLSQDLRSRIVRALLSADAKGIEGRVIKRWGETAVHELLNWIDAHGTGLSDEWRSALASETAAIFRWIESHPAPELATLMFLVRVLDPLTADVQKRDSTIWLHALRTAEKQTGDAQITRLYAFALSLGFAGAPPTPIELVCNSFSHIHELAAIDQLDYDSWLLLEPYVPDLYWNQNWDKCERLQRGLVQAFVKHDWSSTELLHCVKDAGALAVVRKSARKVDGGKKLLKELVEQIHAGKIRASDEQRSALRA
jgi:hypothetical protein